MIRRTLAATAAAVVLLAFGCASTPDDIAGVEAAVTPPNPRNWLEQAIACRNNLESHADLRDKDIEEGSIRWRCGDVPGVSGVDLGQEFCEYHAVQNGKVVRRAASLTTDPVACVFTSVMPSFIGAAPRLREAMADAANLGVAAASADVVQMRSGANSRGVLDARIEDCSRDYLRDIAPRTAACYDAFVASAGTPAADRLRQLCSRNLRDEALWAEAASLGARIFAADEPGFEAQRDLASCLKVGAVGSGWQQSDALICARVDRAAGECGCKFDAPPFDLEGLPFTGAVDDRLPAGCRPAVVDGAAYPYITICEVTTEEVAGLGDTPAHAAEIGNFCRDRFARDLVLKAPLRSLQKPGTCNGAPGFCADYMQTL